MPTECSDSDELRASRVAEPADPRAERRARRQAKHTTDYPKGLDAFQMLARVYFVYASDELKARAFAKVAHAWRPAVGLPPSALLVRLRRVRQARARQAARRLPAVPDILRTPHSL